MDLKKMIPVLVLALAGLATGCGDKCKSVCEDNHKCAGATDKTDCGKECDDLSSLADASSCSSKVDDATDCQADQKDVCSTTDTSCDAKNTAMFDCLTTYCMAHATDTKCTTFMTDIGLTAP